MEKCDIPTTPRRNVAEEVRDEVFSLNHSGGSRREGELAADKSRPEGPLIVRGKDVGVL